MINRLHFEGCVLRPTLARMVEIDTRLYSESAVNLLLGTVAHESRGGHYLRQIKGPALGVYQIEPKTHDSFYANYLKYRPELHQLCLSFAAPAYHREPGEAPSHQALICPLYSTVIARLLYWRVPDPLPDSTDIEGLGNYWNDHFNKNPEKGHTHQFVEDYGKWK